MVDWQNVIPHYYVFDKADANQKSGCFSCNSIEAAEKIANRPQLRKAFYKTPNKSKNGITFYNYSYDNNSILKIWKPNDESNAQTFNLPRDKWAHFKEHLPENESGLTITNQWQRMTDTSLDRLNNLVIEIRLLGYLNCLYALVS